MVLGVKIHNNKTGLFRLKDGSYSKNGKTYSTIGFAKSAITNSMPYNLNKILNRFNDCEFVIFNDDCTIETIPVINHVIDVIKREKKVISKNVECAEGDFLKKHYLDILDKLNIILDGLEKEGE